MTSHFTLTKALLENTVWTWGPANHPPLTTSFRFGSNGRIIEYEHVNEYSWRLIGNILEIFNIHGQLMWRFDSILNTEKSINLISIPHNDPQWETFFILRADKANISGHRLISSGLPAPITKTTPIPPHTSKTQAEDNVNIDNNEIKEPIHNPNSTVNRPKICIRSAYNMKEISDLLSSKVEAIKELNYVYEGWDIIASARCVALTRDLKDPRNREIITKLPGIPSNRFKSDIIDQTSDIYVMSFAQDSFYGHYKSKTTGIIIPMIHSSLPRHAPKNSQHSLDYTSIPYDDIINKYKIDYITEEQWNFFRSEFELFNSYDKYFFLKDIRYILNRLMLSNKKVIIVGINTSIGLDNKLLQFFSEINSLVKPIAKKYAFDYIDVNEIIENEEYLAKNNVISKADFDQKVYKALSDRILSILPQNI